jgi:hypothetical protein
MKRTELDIRSTLLISDNPNVMYYSRVGGEI